MGCAFRIPQTAEEAHRKRVQSLEDFTKDEIFEDFAPSPHVSHFRSLDSFKTDVSVPMTQRPKTLQVNETNESIDISAIPSLPANSSKDNPLLYDNESPKSGTNNPENLTTEFVPGPLMQSNSSRYRPQEVATPVTCSNEIPSENNRLRSSLPDDDGGAPPPSIQLPGKSPEDHSQFDEATAAFLDQFPDITCEASFKNLVYRRYELKQDLAENPRNINAILKRAKDLFQVSRLAMESTSLKDDKEYQCSWRQLALLRNDIKRWTLQCEQAAKEGEKTISMKKRMRKRVDESCFEIRFRNGSMFSVVSRTRTASRARGPSNVSWAPSVKHKSSDEGEHHGFAANPSGPTKGDPTPRFVPTTGTVEEAFDTQFSNFENLHTAEATSTKDDALAKMWSFDSRPQKNQFDGRHINIEGSFLHLGGIREEIPMSPNHLGFASRKKAVNAGKSPSKSPSNVSTGAPELQIEAFSLDGDEMVPMQIGGMRLRTEMEISRFPESHSQASPININNAVREIFETKRRSPAKALRQAKNLFVRSRFALRDLQGEVHNEEYEEAWRMLAELRRLIKYLKTEISMWKAETMQEEACPFKFKKMRTKNVAGRRHKKKMTNLSCYSVSNFDDMMPLNRTNTNFTLASDLKFDLEEGPRNIKNGLSFASIGGEPCPDHFITPDPSRDSLSNFDKENVVASGTQGITALFNPGIPSFHANEPLNELTLI